MNQLATTITDPTIFDYDLSVYQFNVQFYSVESKAVNDDVHLRFTNVRLLDLINTLGYHWQLSNELWKIVPIEESYVVIMSKLCWARIRVIMNTKFILLQMASHTKQASEIPWVVKCLPYNKNFEWGDHVTVSAGIDFLRHYYCGKKGSNFLSSFRPVSIYRLELVRLVFKILAKTFDVWKDTTRAWADNENILPFIRPLATALHTEIYTPFMKIRAPRKCITVKLSTVEISKSPLHHFDAYNGAIAPMYTSLFQYWSWVLNLEDVVDMYHYFTHVYQIDVPLRMFRKRCKKNRTMDERPRKRQCKRVDYRLSRPLYLENPVERKRREDFYKHNCAVVYMVCIGYLRTRGEEDNVGRNPTDPLVACQLLKIKEPYSSVLEPLLHCHGKTVEYTRAFPMVCTDAVLKSVNLKMNIFM